MDHRKNLWIAIIITVALSIILSFVNIGRSSLLSFYMITFFIILPIFASIYAVKTLEKESYLSWFFISMFLPLVVPVILAIQEPHSPPDFSPGMIIAGQRADSFGLGKPENFYMTKSYSYIGYQIGAVLIAFIIGPLISLPFIADKGSNQQILGIILPFAGVIGLSILFIWLIKKEEKKNSRMSVTQYTDGLVYVNKENEPEIIKWENIYNVWQDFLDQYFNGVRTHHKRRCKIELKDSDKKFEFNEKLKGIEELTDIVHESVTPFLLKSMSRELNEGKTLNFGKITINAEGISLKRKFLPWSETAGIYLESGYIVIACLSHSRGTAGISNSLSNISALATSFIGTAQPFAMGGDTVIWKKTSIKITPNPYTLTQLVLNIIKKG